VTAHRVGLAGVLHDLYDVIHRRRDVRGQFTGGPVDPAVLDRVLLAAHAAPSVSQRRWWVGALRECRAG
jgi:5,6-dimethylbenzimidazole synthase